MKTDSLEQLRKELILGDNTQLKDFYIKYIQDCINVLISKNLCSEEESKEVFTEALIIFHKNIINGKIQNLSSVRSYLISTCINLARKKNQYISKTQKKLDEVRLLFYDNNDTTIEERENKEDLISICQKALASLSERCQKIIVAFYIHHLSMKEIAQQLELSSSDVAKTLKSRCHKSLLKEVKNLRN